MLHRKIYQLCNDGRQVSIFLRDQQRWIDNAHIISLEGDLVTIRYEEETDEEMCSWEEMVRLESIGAVSQKMASVSKINHELTISEECPDSEQIRPHSAEPNQDFE